MSNPAKKKGTAGEVEVMRELPLMGLRRTSPGSPWDLENLKAGKTLEVLTTRPDRGKWLAILPLEELNALLTIRMRASHATPPLRIEVKRWKKFAHHSVYTETFGATSDEG